MQATSLKEDYLNKLRPKLKDVLRKENILAVPRLEKIVVNTGFGKAGPDEKIREQIFLNLAKITGQKAAPCRARKAIAGFKIKKGQIIGAKVTLRGNKMYSFFEKLVKIVLPRVRDFRGTSVASFDGRGNYTLGFREISIFPEAEYKLIEKPIGLEICIHTSAENDQEAKELLKALGMPFQKEGSERK